MALKRLAFHEFVFFYLQFFNSLQVASEYGHAKEPEGAFTLARFRRRFRTKLAHLEMKKNYFLQNVQA
jgi:hypothetical protein